MVHKKVPHIFAITLANVDRFYRAMHVVLARYCYRKSSSRSTVRLSVTLMYRGHYIGWTSSKLITPIADVVASRGEDTKLIIRVINFG